MRAEPEDVVDMLSEYYTTIGDLAYNHGATLGAFIGDGALAYFGDPIAVPNPADDALALALALRPHLDVVAERWSRRGFQLGHGIALALGYATLGTVGRGNRREYTALGTVVNLASRLCSEARNGDILIDAHAHDSLTCTAATTPLDVTLKGFTGPVQAYRLPSPDPRT
jgi:class 3 adenylate cyclase